MESDSVRTSGDATLVDMWIEGIWIEDAWIEVLRIQDTW